MRILIFLMLIAFGSSFALAQDGDDCFGDDKKISTDKELTQYMIALKNQFKNQTPEARKTSATEGQRRMNCQMELHADDFEAGKEIDWIPTQYQDLLSVALNTNCDKAKQDFAIKSAGAGQEDLSDEEALKSEKFLNAYCAKSESKDTTAAQVDTVDPSKNANKEAGKSPAK